MITDLTNEFANIKQFLEEREAGPDGPQWRAVHIVLNGALAMGNCLEGGDIVANSGGTIKPE